MRRARAVRTALKNGFYPLNQLDSDSDSSSQSDSGSDSVSKQHTRDEDATPNYTWMLGAFRTRWKARLWHLRPGFEDLH